MMTPTLTDMIRTAGLLHFGILIASALVPQVLDWRSELRKLCPLTRQLVWVHGIFIVLTIVGMGLIASLQPAPLANATALARCLCGFIAVFWGARLCLQFVLFDPAPLLQDKRLLRIGYHALSVVFLVITITFAYAALRPG
jgi:quinol-cytochrome oxidoreductase complex cytochrome b subunit